MRELPNVIEVEKSLLSSMMLFGGEIVPKVMRLVNVEDFYREEHRRIYRAILELYEEYREVDFRMVAAKLHATGDLKEIGAWYFKGIVLQEITNAYHERYALLIKEKSLLRQLIDAGEDIADLAYSQRQDIYETFKFTMNTINRISETYQKSMLTPKMQSGLRDYLQKTLAEEINGIKEYAHRETGFSNLDENQIFTPGLYVLGGLPALGKTTFALQLLYQLAKNGETCIYCSYEMARLELVTKIIAAELFKIDPQTKLSSIEIRRGGTSRTMETVLEKIKEFEADLRFIELQDEGIDDFLSILRPICQGNKRAPVVCLDYLQIVPNRAESAKSGIDEIVRKLKNFQRETKTTFIVISSFNRLNYMQPVSFESFKESGNIEYSADVVWGLQLACMNELPRETKKARQILEQAKREQPRQVQLVCLKNRAGNNYEVSFEYHAAHDYFEPVDDFRFKNFTPTDTEKV